MAREFRILHHRQSGVSGGHWDLVENPIPYRASTADAPHGDGSFCAALERLATDGWLPVMPLSSVQAQSGETFVLLSRSQ